MNFLEEFLSRLSYPITGLDHLTFVYCWSFLGVKKSYYQNLENTALIILKVIEIGVAGVSLAFLSSAMLV